MTESDYRASISRFRRHQPRSRALLFALAGVEGVEDRADGAWITTTDGQALLDFGSFSVFLLGHRPPLVVEAVARQLERLPLSSRILPELRNIEAAEALASISFGSRSRVIMGSSGAEVVEAAIKLARLQTGRHGLAHLAGSYHGKSTGALSLTDGRAFREGLGPLLPEVQRLPLDAEVACAQIEADPPAAVFVEPIQGEGGVVILDDPFLVALRESTRKVGALLVADEIQCGFGRSGSVWRSLDRGIEPDMILAGKALGGGVMPASAMICTEEVFTPYDRDTMRHASTFAGNPLASAAVAAAVETLKLDKVPERAAGLGTQLAEIFAVANNGESAVLNQARGAGALWGLQCKTAEAAGLLLHELGRRGVLLTPCLTQPDVLRVTPPATTTSEDLAHFAGVLSEALLAVEHDLVNESGLAEAGMEDRS